MGTDKPEGLTLVVPAHNEAPQITQAVQRMHAALQSLDVPWELCVVDDGSQDATGSLLDALATQLAHCRVVHHPQCRGAGQALLTGARHATQPWLMCCPVDSPCDAVVLRQFLVARQGVDIVVGYRNRRVGYAWWMRWGSAAYRRCLNWAFRQRLRDWTWMCCYRTQLMCALPLRSTGMAFFPEVLVRALSQGARIAEIPCEMQPRRSGRATASRPRAIALAALETLQVWKEMRRHHA